MKFIRLDINRYRYEFANINYKTIILKVTGLCQGLEMFNLEYHRCFYSSDFHSSIHDHRNVSCLHVNAIILSTSIRSTLYVV